MKKPKDNSIRTDKKYVVMNTHEVNKEVVWVYNFTKLLVCIISLLFVIAFIVSVCVIFTTNPDALGDFWINMCDVLKVCVFGYFIKSGSENIFKLKEKPKTSDVTNFTEK